MTPRADYLRTLGAWKDLPLLAEAQTGTGVVMLSSGSALVAGGYNQYKQRMLARTTLLDASNPKWRELRPFKTARLSPTLTLLKDGRVIAIGGFGPNDAALATSEVSTTE